MRTLYILTLFTCIFAPITPALAAPALNPYTPEYFWILPHTAPAGFEVTETGDFVGSTADGYVFTQIKVVASTSIRLEHFFIGTVDFYVSDKGIIKADSDVMAMSIYLTLV